MPYRLGSVVFVLIWIGCDMSTSTQQASIGSNSDALTAQPVQKELSYFDTIPEEKLVQYLQGKFDPSQSPLFDRIDTMHTDRVDLYLHRDAYTAFKQMHDAAKAVGITLVIRSATRNFIAQKNIWERKWSGATILSSGHSAADIADYKQRALEILKYSSMPGSSRHHWGTDIDLNAFNNMFFEEGEGKEIYAWLSTYAGDYGFCQPYSPKGADRPMGYEEEKWHWSYLPIAKKLTEKAGQFLEDSEIKGFAGAEQAQQIGIVEKYILGINSKCK